MWSDEPPQTVVFTHQRTNSRTSGPLLILHGRLQEAPLGLLLSASVWSVHYGNPTIRKNITFLDFYLTLFPTSAIFSSKRQFRLVLGSKATLLEMPSDLVHTHTSKRPGAYFQVFCTPRLGATSEAAVFAVNSLVFCCTDPSKAASSRELWAGASCSPSTRGNGRERKNHITVHNSSADCFPKVLISNAHNNQAQPMSARPEQQSYVLLLAFERSNFSSCVWWCCPVMCQKFLHIHSLFYRMDTNTNTLYEQDPDVTQLLWPATNRPCVYFFIVFIYILVPGRPGIINMEWSRL